MTDLQYTISRSEQKRRAKEFEKLATELCGLPDTEIVKLPCGPALREDIKETRKLKAGARKRQIKYIAKNLREMDAAPLFTFLAKRQGSKLRDKQEFQMLERLRDDILNDAIAAWQEADNNNADLARHWNSSALKAAMETFPELHEMELRQLAERFARTRKPALRRELFRILRAAQERRRYIQSDEKETGD
jgi:ribosome-associated protein